MEKKCVTTQEKLRAYCPNIQLYILRSQPTAIFLWPDKFDTFDIFKGIFLHAIIQTCTILSFHKLLFHEFFQGIRTRILVSITNKQKSKNFLRNQKTESIGLDSIIRLKLYILKKHVLQY